MFAEEIQKSELDSKRQKQDELLKHKRSLFVRMVKATNTISKINGTIDLKGNGLKFNQVSDPNIYNPKIVKARAPHLQARPSFASMDHYVEEEPAGPQRHPHVSQILNQASPV